MGMDVEKICDANQKYSVWLMRHGDIRCAFSPVIDGDTLLHEPKEAVKMSKIPMIIGNTSQEGNLFLSSIPSAVLPFVMKYIHLDVKKGNGSYKQRACDALTDHIYVRPQMEILKEYQGDIWRYEYCHIPYGNKIGCFHVSELPVLFGMDMFGFKGGDDPVGNVLRSFWGKFSHEGNPGWKKGTTHSIV